mmetsp:Transcript_604/g.1269  ORF Transcript_604/g.1269 Transcript_604/m.1269 type:complete len:202 (-) Transcript_604:864-1469(-)
MMYAGRCISRRNAPSYCCSSLSTFFRPDFVDASSIENCCSMCPRLSNCRRESFLSSTDNVSRRWMMLWSSRSLSRRSWRSPRITSRRSEPTAVRVSCSLLVSSAATSRPERVRLRCASTMAVAFWSCSFTGLRDSRRSTRSCSTVSSMEATCERSWESTSSTSRCACRATSAAMSNPRHVSSHCTRTVVSNFSRWLWMSPA